MATIEYVDINTLTPAPRNARTHSKKQIKQIAGSINAFGFVVPVLTDETGTIIAGHGRHAAARLLGLKQVPAIRIEGLSEAKRRALALADNKIAENAGWDREILAAELPELSELLVIENLDIAITGFAPADIDQIAVDFKDDDSEADDAIDPDWMAAPLVSQRRDLWQLGPHRIFCGDARNREDLALLMGADRADVVFTDPPYNTRVRDIVGRGQIKHQEFAMASGEMTASAFVEFLTDSLGAAAAFSRDGSVHFAFMDWRGIAHLLEASKSVYAEILNIVVWVKSNGGQGSFYRSQHEMIGVFRVGHEAHQNNIELGRHGRSRSNVWHYAGINTFRAGRMDDLSAHPTVKPVALVADAIRDCSKRRDIVLDTFCGSGTTIIAAEKVGRRARAMEIEPRFVDVAIRRWQNFTRRDAVHVESGQTFDECAALRLRSRAH